MKKHKEEIRYSLAEFFLEYTSDCVSESTYQAQVS